MKSLIIEDDNFKLEVKNKEATQEECLSFYFLFLTMLGHTIEIDLLEDESEYYEGLR